MRAHLRRGIMDKKDGPSEGEVLEKVQGWCRGEDGGDGKDDAVDEDDYARAAVCPHAPELVHACYPHCIQSATEDEVLEKVQAWCRGEDGGDDGKDDAVDEDDV